MPAFSSAIFSGVAEIFGVVDVDARDDRAIRIQNIDRVEATTQADFENHRVQSARRKEAHDRQRRELEVSERDGLGKARSCGFDLLEVRQQIGVARHLAVYPRALVKRQQMRRSMTTYGKTGAQQDRFENRACRAFTVRSANRDHRARERQLHRVTDLTDARETHVDADRMRGFKVREPRVEGGECGHRVNREKIIERCDEHARGRRMALQVRP